MNRVLDFFCGIGGHAVSLPAGFLTFGIDIHLEALEICSRNTVARTVCRTIESLSVSDIERLGGRGAAWWMSPPCQPHTRRGRRADLADTRSNALINLIRLIPQVMPPVIGLENVPGFEGTDSHRLLDGVLRQNGYCVQSIQLCPKQLGAINRRPRFWLLASLGTVPDWEPIEASDVQPRLETDLNRHELAVDAEVLNRFGKAMHIVRAEDFLAGKATTRCFTSAYGRSPVASGSYLDDGEGVRRFTPSEILWQLGFPETFELPPLAYRRLWPLTGNTLSQHCLRWFNRHWIAAIPETAGAAG